MSDLEQRVARLELQVRLLSLLALRGAAGQPVQPAEADPPTLGVRATEGVGVQDIFAAG